MANAARLVRIQIRHGEAGMVFATSEAPKLFLSTTGFEHALEALPAVIEHAVADDIGEQVAAFLIESGDSEQSWAVIPVSAAATRAAAIDGRANAFAESFRAVRGTVDPDLELGFSWIDTFAPRPDLPAADGELRITRGHPASSRLTLPSSKVEKPSKD